MFVTMVMVASVDGVTSPSRRRSLAGWISEEDQHELAALTHSLDAVLMGRTTFGDIPRAYDVAHHFVLTSRPHELDDRGWEGVTAVSGPATEVLAAIESAGVERLGLLGGARTNGYFLAADLVNEVRLTIEPRLFGQGIGVVAGEDLDVHLRLDEVRQLNERGTLLAQYRVVKP